MTASVDHAFPPRLLSVTQAAHYNARNQQLTLESRSRTAHEASRACVAFWKISPNPEADMVSNISEKIGPARKAHRCDECGRTIPKGEVYLRQANTDGSQIWTFKAHQDCAALGIAYRTKYRLWDEYDWIPMHELADGDHLLGQWRGHFPHAVCRLEFNQPT